MQTIRGATLAEIIIGNFVFGMLMLGIFALLKFGLSSQARGESLNDLVQETQTVTYRMNRAVGYSSRASLLVENDLLSCLSAWGPNGVQLDANGEIQWHHDLTYYVVQDKLFKVERELDPADSRIVTPASILALGLAPAQLRSGGAVQLEGLESSQFIPTLEGAETVAVSWEFSLKKDIRKQGQNSMTLSLEMSPRHP